MSARPVAVSLGLLLLLTSPGGRAEAADSEASSPGEPPQRSALRHTRLRLSPGASVVRDGLRVLVPPPGTAVWAEALREADTATVLNLKTTSDGWVEVHSEPATATAAGTSGSDPCSDGSYTKTGTKWRRTMAWRFHARSTPSNMGRRSAKRAFRRSARNITEGRNDCGLSPSISATQSYLGTTSRRPNITSSAGCLSRDGYSVVGFGSLPSGYLAMTCWWSRDGAVVEVDMKLNSSSYAWTIGIPSGCRSRWSIDAVATHEFGHAFGLGHVSESEHPHLTMSPMIRPCQKSEATLGLGDIRGLQAVY